MAFFQNTEEIAAVFPFLKSADWPTLKPFVELAELEKLRDEILGPTLFDALRTAYLASLGNTPTPLTSTNSELLARVRPALAFLAAYEAAPTLNVLHSSGGMSVPETDKLKPAHMWRVNQARTAMLKQAYGQLNQLLIFLQTNASTYATWSAAPVYKALRESLVPTVAVAQQYTTLTGPWFLHHLRPAMRRIQEGPVKKILGATVYNALLSAVQASNPNPTQEELLHEARPAILFGAIADQVLSRSIAIDEDGVWNWASVSSGSAVSGGKQPVDKDRLNALVRENKEASADHLEALRLLVTANTPSPVPDRSANDRLFFG